MPQTIVNDLPFTTDYQQKNFVEIARELAGTLELPLVNDGFTFPCSIATGYYKAVAFDKGFTASISNYKVNREFIINRLPSNEFGVIIYLYKFVVEGNIAYTINNIERTTNAKVYHALRVINSQTTHVINVPKNTTVKALAIFLEKDWINANICANTLKVINYLKEVNYFKEFMNAKQQKLLDEIFDVPADHPYQAIFVKSRIGRLLDKLFESFLHRDISETPEKLSEADFSVLQQVEFLLIDNFEQPFPSIEKLARHALMSESKLKKLFKEAFGMGMYEYYQKNRMHKAKELILSGKHSVTEVGLKLGYQNLSNFSSAFRKEFKFLPSEVLS